MIVLALPQRQTPDTDAFSIGRDGGAFGEGVFTSNTHRPDQIGLALRVKILDAQKHYRRMPASSHSKVGVEIVVQGHTYPLVAPSPLQNVGVLGLLHSDFANMNSVQAAFTKNRRRARSEPLVQQKAAHATRSTLNRSSSTVAAA